MLKVSHIVKIEIGLQFIFKLELIFSTTDRRWLISGLIVMILAHVYQVPWLAAIFKIYKCQPSEM